MKCYYVIVMLGFLLSCDKSSNIQGGGTEEMPDKDSFTIPAADHIVVVMEENRSYDQIIGSPNAPYINRLAGDGALFTDAHGEAHPSQPNYLALFSGSMQGVTDDHCLDEEAPFTTPNLGAALLSKGLSFTGFSQSLPYAGFSGCQDQQSDLTGEYVYARKHAPWVNWQGAGINGIPASLNVAMTQFPSDYNQLPSVAFVIPDQDHDMHNTGPPGESAAIERADTWLKQNMDGYVQWAKQHNSMLILAFDEDDNEPENHIPTIFVGEHVHPGKYSVTINHYNMLRTIQMIFGLSEPDTADIKPITGIWNRS